MPKCFSVPCDFGGKRSKFDVWVGDPNPQNHPLHHQATWLAKERGGSIPKEVMDGFKQLYDISQKTGVSFEELCTYAIEEAEKNQNKEGGAPAGAAGAFGGGAMSGTSDAPPSSGGAPSGGGQPIGQIEPTQVPASETKDGGDEG